MAITTQKPIITFVTSNIHKFKEVKLVFNELIKNSVKLRHKKATLVEIQSFSLEEIVSYSIRTFITKNFKTGIFAEDSGIFIKSLNNFPGPYSAFVYETIGLEGILSLMHNKIDRDAYFKSSIALKLDNKIILFTGKVEGQISTRLSESGWGYDPIFIPNNANGLTYGELGQRKLFLSHRYLSTVKLIEYLKKLYFKDS